MKPIYYSQNDQTLANGSFYRASKDGVERYILGDLMDEDYAMADIPLSFEQYSEAQAYIIQSKGA
jgi:hypothetical protein